VLSVHTVHSEPSGLHELQLEKRPPQGWQSPSTSPPALFSLVDELEKKKPSGHDCPHDVLSGERFVPATHLVHVIALAHSVQSVMLLLQALQVRSVVVEPMV
jgi:hypothetical protein